MPRGSFVLIGSGPGIGVATASLFASKGITAIALIARNAERLKSDAASVQAANPSATVKTYSLDVGDHVALKSALEQLEKGLGPPEVVLFNTARIAISRIGEEPPENMLSDFKAMSIGMYVAMSWAQPHLAAMAKMPDARPSFLLSGGTIYRNPLPDLFSLGMQKAAQHNLMMSFSKVVGPKGVHVASVSIAGQVTDEDAVMNAENVARQHWSLYEEESKHWRFEVEVGDLPGFEEERKISSSDNA